MERTAHMQTVHCARTRVCVCLFNSNTAIMPDKDQLGPTYNESRPEING